MVGLRFLKLDTSKPDDTRELLKLSGDECSEFIRGTPHDLGPFVVKDRLDIRSLEDCDYLTIESGDNVLRRSARNEKTASAIDLCIRKFDFANGWHIGK